MGKRDVPEQEIELARFWDAVVRGDPNPELGQLDAERAAFVRRIDALAQTPLPAGAGERARRTEQAARRNERYRRNGKGTQMNGTIVLDGRVTPAYPERRRAIGRPLTQVGRPRRRVERVLSYASAFVLVAAILAGIVLTFRDGHRSALPAGQEIATTIASPSAGWPTMLGNNRRTAVTDATGPVGTFAPLWTFKAPGPLDNVIVAGDAAFLQSEDGALYCLDRMTGHQRWALDTGGPSDGNVRSYPAVNNGTVYAGGRTGDVMAIDAATGAIKWRVHLSRDPIEASILVQDGVVFTGTGGGLFVALNAADGSERWRFNDGQDFVNTFPAFDNGVIYVGGPQSVRAIDASTGKLVWEARTDGQVRGAAVDHGVVYAPTSPGSVYALNEADGHQLWTQTFTNTAPGLSVAVSQGMVVAGFGTGGMMGLEATTGRVVWQTPDSGGVTTASKVSIADGIAYAYFGPRGGELALDVKTGQERGFGKTEEIRMPPSIVDGVLYAGAGAGIAYALVGDGGATTPQEQLATPVVVAPSATSLPASPAAVPTVAAQPLPVKFLASFGGWDPAKRPLGFNLAPDGKIWVGITPGVFDIFDLDGNLLEQWGTPGSEPGQLNFYNGVANFALVSWRPDGSFYVQDLNGIQYFDKDRHFVKLIDPAGGGGRVLTVGPDGTLWVSQANPSRVDHFDADSNKIGGFDGKGTASGILHTPTGIAIDRQGRLYVAEQDNNRVRVFDTNGNELGRLGQDDPGFPGIYRPFSVAIDAAGMIYVCDKDKVDVFDTDWRYLGWFGGGGTADGQFQTTDGVAVNGTKTIYVIDYGNNRVQKFAISGPWPTAPATGTPAA